MMQRDGRGEAVLMPLGDRFGDPISESAALRATFLERPENLASCSRAPRDCGARSTTVAPANVERRRASSGNDAAGQVFTAGGSMRSDCAEVGPRVSLLVFAAGQQPPGRDEFPAGRPRDGPYIRPRSASDTQAPVPFPTMMWSCTVRSRSLAASASCRVRRRSSREGLGSPLGWL